MSFPDDISVRDKDWQVVPPPLMLLNDMLKLLDLWIEK